LQLCAATTTAVLFDGIHAFVRLITFSISRSRAGPTVDSQAEGRGFSTSGCVLMGQRYPLIVSALAAAGLAYSMTPWVTQFAMRIGAVDQPDARKIHQAPMPRLGGLAILSAVVLVLGLAPLAFGETWAIAPVLMSGLIVGLLPIVGISFIDDLRPVPARVKLLCHLTGATLAVLIGVSLPDRLHVLGYELWIGPFAGPISVMWLVGITNAFNIIDGLDGLAAGLAFISAFAVSAVFVTSGQTPAALLPLVLAGAIAGFLPYNVYPARIFLGDTGATAIGFALGVMALKGGSTMSVGFAAATPVLIMGLPIADTLVAIARRLVRLGERQGGGVFHADRNHVHHRLLALGLNHRNAVLVLYALGILTAVVSYASLFVSNRESALLLLALITAGAIGLNRLGYDEFALLRRGTILRVYEAPVLRSSMFVVFVDIAFVCVSAYLAVALKTDDWLLQSERVTVLRLAVSLVPLSIGVFWKTKLYEGSWRLATINDYARATAACAIVVALSLVLWAWQFQTLPASLIVVYGLVSASFVVGSRAAYRLLVNAERAPAPPAMPALIYGPNPGDFAQARDLIDRAASFGLRPVGFLTSTADGHGQWLAGLKVCGAIDDLPRLARSSGAKAVILAGPRATPASISRFEELCQSSDVVPYRLNTEPPVRPDNDLGARPLAHPLLFDLRRGARRHLVVSEADG
jgi:UDP-GlcNAc:undecaprenyl-phosphate/decaprenyl-phosphate GlcNAc-1-phosphate transferase